MGGKAVETTYKINNAFGPGTVNEHNMAFDLHGLLFLNCVGISYEGEYEFLPISVKHLAPFRRTLALKKMKNQAVLP